MSIQYNLDPLAALELFYGGEHHGIYKNAFVRNEKKNDLTLPPMLREFLEKFGYLPVNTGRENSYRIFHPDNMAQFSLPDGNGGEVHIIDIGELRIYKRNGDGEDVFFIGIRTDTPDLNIAMAQEKDGHVEWWGTENTLFGLLTDMFLSVIGKCCDSYIFNEDIEIKAVLRHHGADVSYIRTDDRATAVHFDDRSGEFLVTIYDEQSAILKELRVVSAKKGGKAQDNELTMLTLDEIKELFASEFFGNALNCDFERCLRLQTEIISRLEAAGRGEIEMSDHYRLLGRCLAGLNRLDEAEQQFSRMLEIAKRHAAEEPMVLADAYRTMGNFCFQTGRVKEGVKMSDSELSVRLDATPDDCYNIGMVYANRARYMEGDDNCLDSMIELCELALEQFGKNPRDPGCKYETARMQQLRGNARRRKKELDKLK